MQPEQPQNTPQAPVLPEQQQDTAVMQNAVTVGQGMVQSAPAKKKSLLWLWLVIGGVVVLFLIFVLVGMILLYTGSNDNQLETGMAVEEPVTTSTPCYTIDTTQLKSTTNQCDLKTLVDNGGYFPGIEILTYQINSYGTFEKFKIGYEDSLRAIDTYENVTSETTTIDGLSAIRYEYNRKQSSNVSEIYIGAEEGFRPTYVEIWVDVEGKLDYVPVTGGSIKAFAIRGNDSTQSVESTFNNSLESIRWKR